MPADQSSPAAPASKRSGKVLDDVDVRLLVELQADPRMTMSALARRVGMSPPAVAERVQGVERAGGFAGDRVDVDPAALGLPVTAFARVRPSAGQLARVAELVASLPQVSECHRITGEDCLLVKVHAETVERLGDVLDRLQVHGQSVTSIVVGTLVPARGLSVEALRGARAAAGPAR